ncbi:MAG: putative DNA binding domain-containing protein [Clostridia bacterium]|nr:putative DNA binding domain-containing protein [Clostridia bacterium]
MIDLQRIEKYRENNRIEAKRALGGLPYSVWETYSSFANTMGGVILLGVEELRDKSFHAVDLPNPQALIEKLWRGLNDPRRVSVNILTKKNIYVTRVQGKQIVVVEVPRAHRADKPVYIENNVWSGTYRRGGEGDYRCTPDEISAMRRDSATRTQDMQLLHTMQLDALKKESLAAYRAILHALRPGHALERCSDHELLIQLNAAGTGEDGGLHPSAAGLLMFGRYEEILRAFPQYALSLRLDESTPAPVLEQNLFEFYHTAEAALANAFPRSKTAREAATEALCNCIVNADYRGIGGITVEKNDVALRFSNPGGFRINPQQAKQGGVSDARNRAVFHMLALMGVGEGIGGGIPRMLRAWRDGGRPTPYFSECFEPESTILTLPLRAGSLREKRVPARRSLPPLAAKQLLVEYLTAVIFARAGQMSAVLGISLSRVRQYLVEMQRDGIVIAEGTGKSTVWKLRERAGL